MRDIDLKRECLIDKFYYSSWVSNYNLAIKLMGSCLMKGEGTRTEALPGKAHKYIDYYEKPLTRTNSTTTNPEELLRKQSDESSKKRDELATAPSQNKPPQTTDSFITMSQLLESENEGSGLETLQLNYQSSIIRKPKKRMSQGQQSSNSKSQMKSVIMSQIQKQQNLDCNKSEMDECSKLLIRLQKMDFEFILPKLRAGPLVVPLINYSNYEV